MDLVKIDGVLYDVLVTAIQEKPQIVEGKNSGVAIYRDREIRDIKGVKYAHSITFAPNDNVPGMFDALFSYLFDNIRESVTLEVVHGQDTITYEAAYSTGARAVDYISKVKDPDTEEETDFIGWGDLTVDFRSIETVITPAEV